MEASIGAALSKPTRPTDTEPVVPPSIEAAIAAVVAKPGPANDDTGAGGLPAQHEFELDYMDSRGRRWAGKFIAHVLTIRERAQVGLTRARLLGGVPVGSVDDMTYQLLEMQAWLAVALNDSPAWAKKLSEFHDVGVLGAIYKEVLGYEDRFWAPEAAGAPAVPNT